MNPIDPITYQIMIPILNTFYDVTHSYGWAILLLTVTIKAAMFPLTAKQFKASRQLQLLQPKLVELQAKYKDKPEELQIKMMEFYKEHNANPFASCLPLLIQMPFLFALYAALMDKGFQEKIAHQSFLFIQDLAATGLLPTKDHGLLWDNALLVLFFGASTYWMQKMMTTNPDDPMQKQMLTMMPIMMTAMFAFFPLPSGILLYIAASNVITIAQNYFLMKSMPSPPPPPASQAVIETTPTVVQEAPKSKKQGRLSPPESGKKGN